MENSPPVASVKINPECHAEKCPVCNGFGTVNYGRKPCHACNGKGFLIVPNCIEEDRRRMQNENNF